MGLFIRLAFLCAALVVANHRSLAAETILVLGDSLTAGYGLPEAEGFVPRLHAALQDMGRDIAVINGGVSGDTSAGGLARLEWALQDRPNVMIVELGANDMLRGVDPSTTRQNLEAIVLRAEAAGVVVMLAGMKSAANFGPEYQSAFDQIYPELAKRHDLVFMPFFLEGVAGEPGFTQPDGLHPSADGVGVIVANALPYVLAALGRAKGGS
jgi:acyl-CoA thioesterase-1